MNVIRGVRIGISLSVHWKRRNQETGVFRFFSKIKELYDEKQNF
jgi:hypothetical protein